MPSKWKVVQAKHKQKKRIRLALVTAAVLIALFLAGAVISLANTLTSPWQLDSQKDYRWDNRFNLNLAVRGKLISLINLNPSQKKVTVINLPDATYTDVPGGFGKWQIRSVYDLGGGSLLSRALTSFLGVPVEGFIQLKRGREDYVDWIRQSPFNFFLSLPNMESDLTPLELMQFNLKLWQVRYDKIQRINLESLMLDKAMLPDSTEVFIGDPTKLDALMQTLSETSLREEHKSIAVFNAAGQPLVGAKAARLITNLGGNVIQIANAPQTLNKTHIWGEESATLQRLKQIFRCCGKLGMVEGISSRAEINVVLGEDFFLWLGN